MIKNIIALIMVCFGTTAYAGSTEKQINCLAKAMYFEARGGKPSEQINIANAVINRTQHPKFPDTICGVIADKKHAVQFPWYYNGSSVRDNSTYKNIKERAEELYIKYLLGDRIDTTSGSVFFHAKSIRTKWRYQSVSVADSLHRFYKI